MGDIQDKTKLGAEKSEEDMETLHPDELQRVLDAAYQAYKNEEGCSFTYKELRALLAYIALLMQRTEIIGSLMQIVGGLPHAGGEEGSEHDCTGCGACVDEEDAYAATAPNKKITWN